MTYNRLLLGCWQAQISMGWCKENVILGRCQWSYIFFLLTYRYGSGRVPKIREIGTQRVNIIGSAQILVRDINSIDLPNLQYQSFSVIDRRPH